MEIKKIVGLNHSIEIETLKNVLKGHKIITETEIIDERNKILKLREQKINSGDNKK